MPDSLLFELRLTRYPAGMTQRTKHNSVSAFSSNGQKKIGLFCEQKPTEPYDTVQRLCCTNVEKGAVLQKMCGSFLGILRCPDRSPGNAPLQTV